LCLEHLTCPVDFSSNDITGEEMKQKYTQLHDCEVADNLSDTSDCSTLLATKPKSGAPNFRPSLLLCITSLLTFLTLATAITLLIRTIPHNHQNDHISSAQSDPLAPIRYATTLAEQTSYSPSNGLVEGLAKATASTNKTAAGQWTWCGTSPTEAISRNCTFDTLGNNWVPAPCYDASFALSQSNIAHSNASIIASSPLHSLAMGGFTWHSSPSLSTESLVLLADLPVYLQSQAARGEAMHAFTTENWHVVHCVYMMRSALNALDRVASGEKDVYVHGRAMDVAHAEHCSHVILENEKRKLGVADVSFGMTWCRKVS
jgi:hypothetical protein